ncbi:hypothetical protein [Rathayibacter sp. SD072]|uniref:hypothetical protein n=1 Tax=Rathayibacter sp. SD072 TaxID=2781731 RepID=UPI001A95F4CD|nr:hypothetical protein [Rathayibacter sp. SD072]MBO0985439.1 hypothetical protein [Rathayibacter sp. SD072]
MLALFFEAAGQVALVAVLLGAGLPVLFALGVRSFAVAGGASGEQPRLPVPLLRVLGVACFAIVVLAVVVGLSIILATGFGQEVDFTHVIPVFVPKD